MKISVITVCYNSVNTLQDTLESVLGQTYDDMEHIIVDGNSSDGTVELIRRYEIRYQGKLRWISEADGGIYGAMNKGIALAKGDVIGFLNADDYYQDNQVLADIADALSDNLIDAVFANLAYINEEREVVRTWKGSPYVSGAFQKGWNPAHPTFYCRKSIFDKMGIFDTSISSAADFELMLRFIEKERISTKYLNRNMVYMRIGGSSTLGLHSILRNTKQNMQAFSQNGLHCPFHYPVSRIIGKFFTIKSFIKYFI